MAAGGGAWKVAYADFVTAMMAFFLVMWITSQNDDVKKAIGGYFQDPWGTSPKARRRACRCPTGIKGDAPFADSATGILPQRWPQANHGERHGKGAGSGLGLAAEAEGASARQHRPQSAGARRQLSTKARPSFPKKLSSDSPICCRRSSASRTRSSCGPTRRAARCPRAARIATIGSCATSAASRR